MAFMVDPETAKIGKKSFIHDPRGGDDNKLTLTKALGTYVWDDKGKKYFDFT